MSSDASVKRQLGGMPTGSYNMQDMAFSVREVKPPKVEEEPSTVPSYDLDYDGVICAKDPFALIQDACKRFKAFHAPRGEVKAPFQELEEAVERWIKREGL